MPGRVYHEIFEIAADQFGFVTAAQARDEGIDPQAILMMARRGTLKHISRGLYRLTHFPETELDHYMEAVLWPLPQAGVISHESALVVYGISDVNPARVHVSVPARFRSRRLPPRQIALHRSDVAKDEVTVFRGLPITTAFKAICDCQAAAIGPAIVSQAIGEAEQKGLIGAEAALQLRKLQP